MDVFPLCFRLEFSSTIDVDLQQKMNRSADSDLVNCSCSEFFYDADSEFQIRHSFSCPFNRILNKAAASENEHLHRLFMLQNRKPITYDDVCDDEMDISISTNTVHEALDQFSKLERDRQSRLSLGYGRSLLTFRLVDTQVKTSFKGRAQFKIRRINVIDSASPRVTDNTKLKNVLASFGAVFENIMRDAKRNSKMGDKIQFIVYTDKTPAHDGDSGMPNPISTPLVDIQSLSKNLILPFIIKSFKTYEHILIGDQLIIETVIVRMKGSNADDGNDSHGNNSEDSFRKKGVIVIRNNDDMCLSRAVAVCLLHADLKKFDENTSEYLNALEAYEHVRHDEDSRHNFQRQSAEAVCILSEVPMNVPTTDQDIQKIAEALNVQIKIISWETFSISRVFGSAKNKWIYLLERKVKAPGDRFCPDYGLKFQRHFDAVIDVRMLRKSKYYCEYCDVAFEFIQSHICTDINKTTWCFACYDRNCKSDNSSPYDFCRKCGLQVTDQACKLRHEKLNICDKAFCKKCCRSFPKKILPNGQFQSLQEALLFHTCWNSCHLCGRRKTVNSVHKCFMLRQPLRSKCSKFLFLDFETDQSANVHRPVYCVINWVELNDEEEIIYQKTKTFGVDYAVSDDVGSFLFSTNLFHGFTCIAHNMRGFDGCFLLRYLIDRNIHVEPICNGLKLTSVFIPHLEMRLIDSLNFFQMPLSGIVSAMGIENVVATKGYFPHFFTARENFNYIGPMPAPEFYGCLDLKSRQYKEFSEWYEQHKNEIFNFSEEIHKYCSQDVLILQEGCLKFRKTLIEMSRKVPPQIDVLPDEDEIEFQRQEMRENPSLNVMNHDPDEGIISPGKKNEFDLEGVCDPFAYLTAAGFCSAMFKAKSLIKNSIAQILPSGYENFRHSTIALEYLTYCQKKYPNLQFCLNTYDGKEYQIERKWRVDGFVPDKNLVIEFYGCFWHGCPECIKDLSQIHPVRKVTFQSLLDATLRREHSLRNAGYNVETIWECQWKEKKLNKEVKKITDSIFIKSRLSPREAFRGGRVEAGKLIYDINKSQTGLGLAYVDICSLYPTVNCYEYYPVGHPEIITSGFESLCIDSYFGLIQCAVLPPKQLRNGVLPVHSSGKLLFPLCRTCAEKMQVDPCTHSEEERTLYGVWVSEELKQAVGKGYEIKHIYCVHHFARKSNQLFAHYIKTFFKMKLAASKRPPNETPEELMEFINKLQEKDGIYLQPEDFHENAGVRNIAKLCCNCFWGRLGMRDSFPKVVLARSAEELCALFSDSTKTVTNVRYVSDDCVCAMLENTSMDTLTFTNNTNIYIAVFTTAFARMRLYNLIDKVGDRFVYCDTDSVIYELSSHEKENLEIGQFMGDLTNELDDGEVIEQFVSGGPKVYAYVTNKGKSVIKIKGFQLNERSKNAFSFENLKCVIETFVRDNLDSTIDRVRFNDSVRGKQLLRKQIFDQFHASDLTSSSAVARPDALSICNVNKILRTKQWELLRGTEQKMFTYSFKKRIVRSDFSTIPYGFVVE